MRCQGPLLALRSFPVEWEALKSTPQTQRAAASFLALAKPEQLVSVASA